MPTEPMVVVRTTLATEAQAQDLAQALLKERIAVCVHSWPMQSSYVWKGGLEHATEFLVEARTTAAREMAVRARMAKGHPYELPVIESLGVEVNGPYAQWASRTLERPDDPPRP